MKTLNLNEGSFPIEMDLNLNSIDVPDIGILKDTLDVDLKISKLSLNLMVISVLNLLIPVKTA